MSCGNSFEIVDRNAKKSTMKKSLIITGLLSATVMVSCVSKKKYTELESNLFRTQTELATTEQEKAELQEKMQIIENRVAEYNLSIINI